MYSVTCILCVRTVLVSKTSLTEIANQGFFELTPESKFGISYCSKCMKKFLDEDDCFSMYTCAGNAISLSMIGSWRPYMILSNNLGSNGFLKIDEDEERDIYVIRSNIEYGHG
ncbi:uncharacterized protein N7482_009396 [Penicillium canariense]|uniref:Uncharacterized protein n=1 Tax=Penicillium canariense TaxID=189055 RepID=A0A9W9LFT0_9EURO|nr:uncharacterized protein N7482_009396 [Penicillium canariense]KAJ5152918.1 hypothetical protein N7482_009396 [Penicillium canariense]